MSITPSSTPGYSYTMTADLSSLESSGTISFEIADWGGDGYDTTVEVGNIAGVALVPDTIEAKKNKICWHHDDLHIEDIVSLPEDYWMDTMTPTGSALITLAGKKVTEQSVNCVIGGKNLDKWEYKDKENLTGNIKEFKVEWKQAKFDYKNGLHMHTHSITKSSTIFCIHSDHVSGAFTVKIDGTNTTNISYNENKIITTDVPYEPQKEDNSHVHFNLPYELTADMTIEVTGTVQSRIRVKDYYTEKYAKAKIVSAFDPALFPEGSNTEPKTLEYTITLGDPSKSISWSSLVYTWEKIDDDHWENK